MKIKGMALVLCVLTLLTACSDQPTTRVQPPTSEKTGTATANDSRRTDASNARKLPSISEVGKHMANKISKNEEKIGTIRAKFRSASGTERAKLEKEMSTVISDSNRDISSSATLILDLIEANPEGDDVIKGLKMIFDAARDQKVVDKATAILEKHLSDSDQIGSLLSGVADASSATSVSLLKNLSEHSPHKRIRASAAFNLYQLYEGVEERREWGSLIPEMKLPNFVKTFDRSKYDMVALYQTLAENYPDVEVESFMGRETIANLVQPIIFKLKNLAVGKVAPEIEGIDIDGEAFKLSDYRGKVVLLDFWGDW